MNRYLPFALLLAACGKSARPRKTRVLELGYSGNKAMNCKMPPQPIEPASYAG